MPINQYINVTYMTATASCPSDTIAIVVTWAVLHPGLHVLFQDLVSRS